MITYSKPGHTLTACRGSSPGSRWCRNGSIPHSGEPRSSQTPTSESVQVLSNQAQAAERHEVESSNKYLELSRRAQVLREGLEDRIVNLGAESSVRRVREHLVATCTLNSDTKKE